MQSDRDIQIIPKSRLAAWCEHWRVRLSSTGWLLAGIVAFAFLIRAVMVQYGLPLLLYEDEPIYYNHALGFGLGHWQIPYFKKPSFFLYFYSAFYFLGYLYTPFMTWKAYVADFWRDPTYVATVGRTLTAIFATGSVYLLARIGARAFTPWVGLTAAFLLAVDPTHLRVSPIVISDTPALFFIIASAWYALGVSERGRLRDYMLCALMIALAMSFKYNFFSVFFLVSAHGVRAFGRRNTHAGFWRAALADRKIWLSLALIPVFFLALNPMIILDFGTFWEHINMERRHMLLRNPHSATEQWQFMASFPEIFFRILPKSLNWPLYVLSLLGVPWLFRKYPRRAFVLLSFPLVFLLVVLQFRLINAKYLMPLFPFLYLSAAVLVHDWLHRAAGRKAPAPQWALAVGFTLIIFLIGFPSLADSAKYASIYARKDTRNLATRYVHVLAAENDRFLFEPETLSLNNRIFGLMVVADREQDRFVLKPEAKDAIRKVNLAALRPRYVMLEFGRIQKKEDARGNDTYEMPYARPYYETLTTHYRFKEIFPPYTIHLEKAEMAETFAKTGFGGLYSKIQQNKTTRQRPGPLLLFLERS